MSQVQVVIAFLSSSRIFQPAVPITLDLHAYWSEFSTRQGRTRVWMKQVSCRGLALAQRSAFPWCQELVSELDRESREHPVLRDRLVR